MLSLSFIFDSCGSSLIDKEIASLKLRKSVLVFQ